MNTLLTLLVMLLLQPLMAISQNANALLKKVDENLMPESYEAIRRIINEEPDGSKKEFTFFTVKKGKDKIAMLYLAPASEKGRAALRLGENMWLYIPNVNKPIRITSLQSIVGGVFNNADLMQLEYHVEYDAAFTDGTGTEHILELKAKSRSVAYDRLKMWVTKEGSILRKVEAYASSGLLIKTLEFKEDKDFGNGLVRPSVMVTTSPLYKGYRSYMIYERIRPRVLPDEAFTLNYLGRLEDLR